MKKNVVSVPFPPRPHEILRIGPWKIYISGFIPEHECEELQSVNITANDTTVLVTENCYIDVISTKDNVSTITEQRECTHIFPKDNTYSSQVND